MLKNEVKNLSSYYINDVARMYTTRKNKMRSYLLVFVPYNFYSYSFWSYRTRIRPRIRYDFIRPGRISDPWLCEHLEGRTFETRTPCRISIWNKNWLIFYFRVFTGGEKSNKKHFRIKTIFTLTEPLVKTGGQIDSFEIISDPH